MNSTSAAPVICINSVKSKRHNKNTTTTTTTTIIIIVSADMKSLKPLLKCLTISNCIVKIVKRVVMR